MVVLKEGARLTVLEGNRRLAAIRLLSDPALAAACKVQVPTVSNGARATLGEVTVYAIAERSAAQDFIGFKHINGPHRWNSIAKARFAANWYERERKSGTTLKDIARRMGDRHDTVKRMVFGIFVLDQARKNALFDVSGRYPGRIFAFSHLYTALTRPGFRKFLGLPEEWRMSDPEPDPVPPHNLDNLKLVMIWLYGSEENDIRPIVTSQNPHIRELDEVLAKPTALAILVSRNNLTEAHAEVEAPSTQFERALVNAKQNAQSAMGTIGAFKGDDTALMEIADVLRNTSRIIFDNMRIARDAFLKSKDEGSGNKE